MAMTFKATGHWDGCMRVNSMVRNFNIAFDEPNELGGEDTAPNPVEVMLSSLVGCLSIVTCMVANEKNISYEAIDVTVEGDLDPRGMTGQFDNVRPGMLAIRYNLQVKGDIDEAQLNDFLEEIEKRCPVSDTLKNGTEIIGSIAKI